MSSSPLSEGIRGLVLDMDGTLLNGEDPLPGFQNLFVFLESHDIPFVIASNNATRSPQDDRHRLAELGVRVPVTRILTAGIATVAYLERVLEPGSPLYVIGERALWDPLQQAGFELRQDASQPVAAVVVGGDSTLTYRKLKDAALLLQRGGLFVGTNPDVAYASEQGLAPEAGATLAALQAVTGRVPTVIGKPERCLFDLAVDRMGIPAPRVAVVGDRLETDILGGQAAGLKTILVTTGVDNRETVARKGIYPDWVLDGLDALVDLLRNPVKVDPCGPRGEPERGGARE